MASLFLNALCQHTYKVALVEQCLNTKASVALPENTLWSSYFHENWDIGCDAPIRQY